MMKWPARPGELVEACPWIQERAEPPGALGYRRPPELAKRLRLALVQAEGWTGSEAPALLKGLFLFDWAAVELVLPQLMPDRDSWSWRRT